MTQIEAEAFVQQIQNIFEFGTDPNELRQFYTDDVVGHVNNESFGIDAICNRLAFLNDRYPRRKFLVHKVIAFENTIIAKATQTFFDEKAGLPVHTETIGIYQMEGNKAKQVWLMPDTDINYFAQPDSSDNDAIDITLRDKELFFKFIKTYGYYYKNERVELTERETESLYYFLNGYSAKEAAQFMHVSNRTFEGYIATVKDKYHCSTKMELRNAIFPNGK